MAKVSNVRAWARILAVATFVASLQILNISLATPAAAVQDDLTASMEAPGIWTPPSTFTDLITESFDSRTTLAAGTSLSIGTVATMANQTISAQSGGTVASPTWSDYSVANTDRGVTNATVWGGAGGTGKFAYLGSTTSATHIGGMAINLPNVAGVSPADNTYRYVGFWWSAGNSPNIVRLMKNGVLQATFTTASLIAQLGSAPSSTTSNDYFGNPNTQFNSDDSPCPSGNTCTTNGFDEPYAFIHLRLSSGFDQIQFAGNGFEFDSVSIRRFVPPSSDGETSIVGSGVVASCSSFSNENAQYVLRNGSFEDDYFTNAAGTTTGTIQSYFGSPATNYRTLSDADSGASNRIQFWNTTASDNQIELQHQVPGWEAAADRNTSGWDRYFARQADGFVHAEIQANGPANLYQDIVTIGGEKITWSVKHRGRFFGENAISSTSLNHSTATNNRDKFEIQIGSPSGSLSTQTPSKKRLPDVVWNTADATYTTSGFINFATNATGFSAGTIYTRLEDGWVLYTGTYTVPAGQNSTRFSFNSVGGASSDSAGNLIDDIRFDPIIACPRTVTIQKNTTATYSVTPLLDSQIPNYTYPETTSLTSVSINGGDGDATFNSSTGQISLSSNTVGTFQVLYTITDINNQTSTSTITVNVEDIDTQLPDTLLVDPRSVSIPLPSRTLSGSTNAMVCIQQVADAAGTALSGSPTITVGRSTSVNNVTFTQATNMWRFVGSLANIQTQIPTITISGSDSSALAPSESKFVRLGVTAATTLGAGACYTGESQVVELRSVGLRFAVNKNVAVR